MLLAEASARDPYYFDNGYDVAYDWTSQLGKWAWGLVWDSYKNTMLAYNLDSALSNRPDGYHPDALVFRFLNNNDTGERFVTQHGEAMTRVSTAMLLTLPGIPCVYTGDELGAEFEPYKGTDALDWKEKVSGFLDYHKKLISLRRNTPSLHSRLWKSLEFKAIPQEVYGYVRYTNAGDPPAIVLLNFFEEPALMQFNLPQEYGSIVKNGILTDVLNDEVFSVDLSGTISIQVPALTARILMKKES
jgi:glycosidase